MLWLFVLLQLAETLYAIMSQYDNEDFDLGIKQFMIEQAIQQVGTGSTWDGARRWAQAVHEMEQVGGHRQRMAWSSGLGIKQVGMGWSKLAEAAGSHEPYSTASVSEWDGEQPSV